MAIDEESTSLVEVKAAGENNDSIAEDDPESNRLMVDYMYLGNDDPNSIVKEPPYDMSSKRIGSFVHACFDAQQTPYPKVTERFERSSWKSIDVWKTSKQPALIYETKRDQDVQTG
ncbi:hypothetical protein LTR56_026831 [Elasticomyces elasticus]|nr:hypothetical protein LTR56_026831 [Elasticomyces elasticus]KAK3617118.1 hypothetical protein LTR22_026836 [Elasticomyces elasticus]KAK4899575.1 hypothetical protein LTR49_027633 [Elasticomyces elasticus]KAK5735411.1 hypothetical protein LTS12_026466 [Elasticomyces elasticus]